MMTDAQREELLQFFGGYFHEDWMLEADSPDGVLSIFARDRGPRVLEDLRKAIVAFVDEHPDDKELEERLFKDLRCYFSPRAAGISPRAWLLDVAAKLKRG